MSRRSSRGRVPGRVLSNEERYELDDKRAIMDELRWCLSMEKPLPEWLRDALLHALIKATLSDIDSWDDVFGPPPSSKSENT
jgi:hypothetical protein